MDDPRAIAFRRLKPVCVEISKAALQPKNKQVDGRALAHLLDSLLSILKDISSRENVLDVKLADYVFFPLSHIFRDINNMSIRVKELCLSCLKILIERAWKVNVQADLAKQLLILLTFIIGGRPEATNVAGINEEIGLIAFECLNSLTRCCDTAGLAVDGKIKTENVPILGHIASLLLDGIAAGPSIQIQLAASSALSNLLHGLSDAEALQNISPGIVSSFTKVLTARSKQKPPSKLVIAVLASLQGLLVKLFSGKQETSPGNQGENHAQGNSWADATAPQIKMAMANVILLRNDNRTAILQALSDLCFALLETCRAALQVMTRMMVETLIIATCNNAGDRGLTSAKLASFMQNDQDLLDCVKEVLFDWTMGMSREMQSSDDIRKTKALQRITTAYALVQNRGSTSGILEDLLLTNMVGSLSFHLQTPQSKMILDAPEDHSILMRELKLHGRTTTLSFPPLLTSTMEQTSNFVPMLDLLRQMQRSPSSVQHFVDILPDRINNTSGHEQLAAYWLALQMVRADIEANKAIDQFLNIDAITTPGRDLLDSLYAFTLKTFTAYSSQSEELSWQLQSLAVETLALKAHVEGEAFRTELVDSLYPILERLGADNAGLQKHAVASLNVVSRACAYSNPADMVIGNADYLVNAIASRLNTFDIRPQATQVLIMMLKLCGPTLIPYLDDLVETMFTILACYHGYPKLVESVFGVLKTLIEEGAKAPIALIEDARDTTTRPRARAFVNAKDTADHRIKNSEEEESTSTSPIAETPHVPFADLSNNGEYKDNGDATEAETNPLPLAEPPPPRPSKTYTMVTKITSLAPAHLTSPSAQLRTDLLYILTTSFPIIALDTDIFLPIAAQIWPYITNRLFSATALPYETLAAAEAMNALLRAAGDFLFRRVDEAWQLFEALYWRAEDNMRIEIIAARGRTGGPQWRCWDGIVRMMVSTITDVGLNEDPGGSAERIFAMLAPWVGGMRLPREELRSTRPAKCVAKSDALAVHEQKYEEKMMSEERREEVAEALELLNSDFLYMTRKKERLRRSGNTEIEVALPTKT